MNHYAFAGLDRESREIVSHDNHRDHHMAEIVMEAIDETLGVAKIHLTGKIRRSQIVDARQMYCNIMRNFTNLSLSAIGRTIYRDHSTVIHSLKKHAIKLEVDPAYTQGYTELLDSIIYQIEYKNAKEKH